MSAVLVMAEREHEEEVEEMVKLQSSEGEVFQVPIKVAKVSRTLAVMLTGTMVTMVPDAAYPVSVMHGWGSVTIFQVG